MKLSIRSPQRGRFTALSFGILIAIAVLGLATSPPASAQLAAADGGVPADAAAPSLDTQPVPITVLTTNPGDGPGPHLRHADERRAQRGGRPRDHRRPGPARMVQATARGDDGVRLPRPGIPP